MDMLKKALCLMMLCMVVISVPYAAEAVITCNQVTSKLSPCVNYLKNGGAVPAACCSGVKGLNSAANTTPDRQAACRCLVSASKSIKPNPTYASSLPGRCGVSIPYPISANTDCSKIQ